MKNNILANNKKAFHDFEIIEKYEAGIELLGTEIKSLRAGKCNLKDSYARISKDREVFVYNFHISKYENAGYADHNPDRPKKLLLHRSEINKLWKKVTLSGYTLVPTAVYLKNRKAKVELALARGKKLHDKREALKKKDIQRNIERELRG